MEVLREYLLDEIIKSVVVYLYTTAEAAAEAGDFWSMRALWRESTKASICAEHFAVHGNLAAIEWFRLLRGPQRQALLYSRSMAKAAAKGQYAVVHRLIELGAYYANDIACDAAASGKIELLELVREFPNTKQLDDLDSRIVDVAISNNKFEMVKYLVEHCVLNLSEHSWLEIVNSCNLDMFKWFIGIANPLEQDCRAFQNFGMLDAFMIAVEQGCVPLAKWIFENRQSAEVPEDFHFRVCDIDKDELADAATDNHIKLEFIRWLNEELDVKFSTKNIDLIFKYGYFDIVKYVCDAMWPQVCVRSAIICAAKAGRFDVVKFTFARFIDECGGIDNVRESDMPDNCDYNIDEIIGGGDLDMIKWFDERRGVFGDFKDPIANAVICGDIGIIEWLYSRRFKCSLAAVYNSVSYNMIEIFKWLIAHGVDISKENNQINLTIILGQLEFAKILHQDFGQKCHGRAISEAFSMGFIPIIEWLIQVNWFGVEFDIAKCITAAVINGHLELLMRLNENGFDVCNEVNLIHAIKCAHLDIVIWMFDTPIFKHKNRCDVDELISGAKKYVNSPRMVAYLESRRAMN